MSDGLEIEPKFKEKEAGPWSQAIKSAYEFGTAAYFLVPFLLVLFTVVFLYQKSVDLVNWIKGMNKPAA